MRTHPKAGLSFSADFIRRVSIAGGIGGINVRSWQILLQKSAIITAKRLTAIF
jgi:hypothetical protein